MMREVIGKINRLTLLSQTAAVWCENSTKHVKLMLTVTALLQFWRFTWSLMDTDVPHLRRNLHNSNAPEFQTQTVESFWHQDTGHTLKIVKEILFPIAQHVMTTEVYLNIKTGLSVQYRVFPRLSFFFPVTVRPNAGHGLLILEVSRSHTTTHHSR